MTTDLDRLARASLDLGPCYPDGSEYERAELVLSFVPELVAVAQLPGRCECWADEVCKDCAVRDALEAKLLEHTDALKEAAGPTPEELATKQTLARVVALAEREERSERARIPPPEAIVCECGCGGSCWPKDADGLGWTSAGCPNAVPT